MEDWYLSGPFLLIFRLHYLIDRRRIPISGLCFCGGRIMLIFELFWAHIYIHGADDERPGSVEAGCPA